jgi:hypothetical protein
MRKRSHHIFANVVRAVARCQAVAFVVARLQNKTSHVKWKALLVVKHVAAKGAPEFKLALQRQHLGDLKQLLSFTGPPDPLRQVAFTRWANEF